MESITLERTGMPPLKFRGRLLATASSQFAGATLQKPNVEWFEVSVYQLEAGFVVAVAYHRDFKGVEDKELIAEHCRDPAEWLREFVDDGEPLELLIGRRANPQMQLDRETTMLRRFSTLVSAVLRDFPEVIGEEGMG